MSIPGPRSRMVEGVRGLVAGAVLICCTACTANVGTAAEQELQEWYPDHALPGLTLEDTIAENTLPGFGGLSAEFKTTTQSAEGVRAALVRVCEFDPEEDAVLTYSLEVKRLTVPLDCEADADASRAVAAWDAVDAAPEVVRLELGSLSDLVTADRAGLGTSLQTVIPRLCEVGWCAESALQLSTEPADDSPITEIRLDRDLQVTDELDVAHAILTYTPADRDLDMWIDSGQVRAQVSRIRPAGLAALRQQVIREVPGSATELLLEASPFEN